MTTPIYFWEFCSWKIWRKIRKSMEFCSFFSRNVVLFKFEILKITLFLRIFSNRMENWSIIQNQDSIYSVPPLFFLKTKSKWLINLIYWIYSFHFWRKKHRNLLLFRIIFALELGLKKNYQNWIEVREKNRETVK